jgi:uncharacterized protein (DUF2062 family)
MSRKLFKRFLPDHRKIIQHKSLHIFGKQLHNPNLWHLNRYSVATAFSVGLFCAFIPIPFQMVLAASIALVVKANLPLSIALVWLTNPITIPPIFYFCYYVGTRLLRSPLETFQFELSFKWIMGKIGFPFLLGSLVCAIVFAVLGNICIRLIWRYSVIQAYKRRQKRQSQYKKS